MAEEGENEVNSPNAQQPIQRSVSTSSVSTSSVGESRQRIKSRKDPLVEVIGEIGSSLKDYCSSLKEYLAKKNQEQSQPSSEEIHAMVSKVPGLTQYEMFKIIDKLMHGGT